MEFQYKAGDRSTENCELQLRPLIALILLMDQSKHRHTRFIHSLNSYMLWKVRFRGNITKKSVLSVQSVVDGSPDRLFHADYVIKELMLGRGSDLIFDNDFWQTV